MVFSVFDSHVFYSRTSNGADIAEVYKSSKKNDPSAESKSSDDAGDKMEIASSTPIPVHQSNENIFSLFA